MTDRVMIIHECKPPPESQRLRELAAFARRSSDSSHGCKWICPTCNSVWVFIERFSLYSERNVFYWKMVVRHDVRSDLNEIAPKPDDEPLYPEPKKKKKRWFF